MFSKIWMNFVGPRESGRSRQKPWHHCTTNLRGGWERRERREKRRERPIENIFYGQPTAAPSSRRNCGGLDAVVAQNEPQSIFPLMNGLGGWDGTTMPCFPGERGWSRLVYFVL